MSSSLTRVSRRGLHQFGNTALKQGELSTSDTFLKMPKRFRWWLVALVLPLSGCASMLPSIYPPYSAPLVTVDRSTTTAARGGAAGPITPTGASAHRYEDGLVSAETILLNDGVGLKIRNKATSTMRLSWDEAAFIDASGAVARVMHSGVRYMERDRSQPPSIIPAGATLEDQAVPVDRVRFTSGQYGGWNTSPLLPASEAVPGKRFGLLIPLELEGEKLEYTFWFQVDNGPAPQGPALPRTRIAPPPLD